MKPVYIDFANLPNVEAHTGEVTETFNDVVKWASYYDVKWEVRGAVWREVFPLSNATVDEVISTVNARDDRQQQQAGQ